MSHRQLPDLIKMDSPEAVLKEVQVILDKISPDFNKAPIIAAFTTTASLYSGNYPGYRACNTDYHDLRHVTDTFLAMARLIHGAILDGESFSRRSITLALIAALLHDSGYIQEENDREGTGAKYTADHVQRSILFFNTYAKDYRFSDQEIEAGKSIILCTDLYVDFASIKFSSDESELLGKMLGTADLLAQMADRIYLEKCLFLYRELEEGQLGDFDDETEFFRETIRFYDSANLRFETVLDATYRFMVHHFSARWNINRNLYREAMDKQKRYLLQILEIHGSKPRNHLKRAGIVERIYTDQSGT